MANRAMCAVTSQNIASMNLFCLPISALKMRNDFIGILCQVLKLDSSLNHMAERSEMSL